MNFQIKVLDRSHEKPVLVDFWAPWCGPCQILGPILEQLVDMADGEWELVKINTEEFPEIASSYRVMSIPNVMLFMKGEVVDSFAGAYPEHWIKNWLTENMPSKVERQWSSLQLQFAELEKEEVLESLNAFLEQFPEHKPARFHKAKILLLHDPENSRALLSTFKMHDPEFQDAQYLNAVIELLLLENVEDDKTSSLLRELQAAIRAKDFESAATKLIKWVQQDRQFQQELPRGAGVGFFICLGHQHPVTKKYRRQFDMAIY